MKEIVPYIIILGCAVAFRFIFLINANVPTGSMNDTIPTGSRILGTTFAYWFGGEPERGDIIVFEHPDEHVLYVKRVVGIPGDTVEIKGGVTYVNGEVYDEPWLKETPTENDYGPYIVPEDSVFCLGDNRNNSSDARFWKTTFVSYDLIKGKAYLLYWPFSEFKWLY